MVPYGPQAVILGHERPIDFDEDVVAAEEDTSGTRQITSATARAESGGRLT
jgi:hypothetical protein